LLRAAPAVAFGLALACLMQLVFVPSVVALYESRGSPPVNVDSALLSLLALIANVIVLVLIVVAVWRSAVRRAP
jgi:hypothetical protein